MSRNEKGHHSRQITGGYIRPSDSGSKWGGRNRLGTSIFTHRKNRAKNLSIGLDSQRTKASPTTGTIDFVGAELLSNLE
jgi:hypothetical protein